MATITLFWNAKSWGIAAIALLLSPFPVPAMAQTIGSSDRVPYRLLLPLLQTASPPGKTTQLQVGAEFPELPVALPIPQSGTLQWSLIDAPPTPQSKALQCNFSYPPQSFTLLFEIPGARSPAETAYLAQLQDSGWQTSPPEQPPLEPAPDTPEPEAIDVEGIRNEGTLFIIGYHDSDIPLSEPIGFYEPNGDAVLRPYFFQPNPGATKLRLDLEITQPNASCEPTFPELISPELFPESGPLGSDQIEVLGDRSGINNAEVQLSLQSPLSLETLANQFATLMSQQGWGLQTSSGNDRLQWSVWSLLNAPNSLQKVTITLVKTPSPNQYIGIFGIQALTWETDLLDFLASLDFDMPTGALPKATAMQILRDSVSLSDNEPYELWVGQLPTGLPAELQTPSDATLLGGVFDSKTTTAILETSLHPQSVQTFYQELLTVAGWQVYERFNLAVRDSSNLGFETSDLGPLYLNPPVFCQKEEGTEIALYTQPGPDNLTTIKLKFYPSGELSPCRVDQDFDLIPHPDFRADLADASVPRLQIPPETHVVQGGREGGRTYFSSAISLKTLLSGEALTHHYAEQLSQSGWTELMATQADGSSVSLWQIESDTGSVWQGVFSLIAQPAPGYWTGSFSAYFRHSGEVIMAIINLFSNAKFWGLGAIALLISTLPIPAIAQLVDNGDKVPYRLLIPLLQPAPPPGEAAQLQVGSELPALPIDLPTPQSGVLQWSLINRPQYFTLLFEVAQSRSQAEATYLEQLQASGWRPWSIEQLYPESSFPSNELGSQPSSAQLEAVERSVPIVLESRIVLESYIGSQEHQLEPLVFCKQDSDARITLGLFQSAPDRTKFQIGLVAGQPSSICDRQARRFPQPFAELALSPPTDAQIDLFDGGSNINYAVNIQTTFAPRGFS